jgi:hypothetical protein
VRLNPWRRPAPPPSDAAKTDAELSQMEEILRRSIQAFFRKVRFIDTVTKIELENGEVKELLHEEDKLALANEGIEAVIQDFVEYMRTRSI